MLYKGASMIIDPQPQYCGEGTNKSESIQIFSITIFDAPPSKEVDSS